MKIKIGRIFNCKGDKNSTDFTPGWYKLETSWDSFPPPIPDAGHKSFFSGREEDIKKLSQWIQHSHGGSVLVSGVRGVGKTAFVYKAVNQAILQTNYWDRQIFNLCEKWPCIKRLGYLFQIIWKVIFFSISNLWKLIFIPNKMIFVDINAARLKKSKQQSETTQPTTKTDDTDNHAKNEDPKLVLLKQIVLSLVFSSCPDKNKLQYLFLRSIGSWETDMDLKKDLTIQLMSKVDIGYLIPVALSIVVVSSILHQEILGALLAVITAGILTFTYHKQHSLTEKIIIDSRNFDYLYTKFNQFLTKSKYIFVFVIDETDKLEDYKYLNDLIQSLKNLFTVSSGRFIFITTQDYEAQFIDTKEHRPIQSTYFNWKIFLSSSEPDEIQEYLSKITQNKLPIEKCEEIAAYLYARTGGVFSLIKEVIRREFIELKTTDSDLYFCVNNENFGDLQLKIARMGRLLSRVHNNLYKKETVSSQELDYIRGEMLYAVFSDLVFDGKSRNISIESMCESYKNRGYDNKHLSGPDRAVIKEAIRALIDNINRYSKDDGESLGIGIASDDNTPFLFSFDISQASNNVRALNSRSDQFSPPESELISLFKKLKIELSSSTKRLSFKSNEIILDLLDSLATYNSIQSQIDSLKPGDPKTNLDSVRERVKETKKLIFQITDQTTLLLNYLNMLFAGVIEFNLSENLMTKENSTESNNNTNLCLLTLKEETQKLPSRPILITKPLTATQISRLTSNWTSNWKTQANKIHLFAFDSNTCKLLKNQLPTVQITEITNTNSFSSIAKLISSDIGLTIRQTTMPAWTSSPKENNGTHKFDGRLLDPNYSGILKELKFTASSQSPYWRAGINFGGEKESDLIPLGEKFSLVHIHKDEQDDKLKYRIITYDHQDEKKENLLNYPTSEKINVHIKRSDDRPNYIDLYVNKVLIGTAKVRPSNLIRIWVLGWGDTHDDTHVQFSNIQYNSLYLPFKQTKTTRPKGHSKNRIKLNQNRTR